MLSFDDNKTSTSALRPTCHYRSKYEKWYWMIIQKSENRRAKGDSRLIGSTETHHVIPECLHPKGWDHIDASWTCTLTPREHYIVHLLLAKQELTLYVARSVTRFLNNKKHPHLVESYTRLRWLGRAVVSRHGYNAPPYRNTATSKSRQAKDLWALADQAYFVWCAHDCGGIALSTHMGVRRSTSTQTMVKLFRKGWVPNLDSDWIEFKNGR